MTKTNNPKLLYWVTRDLAYVYYKGKETYFGKWGSLESYEKYDEFVAQIIKEETRPAITLRYVVERFLEARANYYVKRGESTRQLKTYPIISS